jgi:hypothetical protein
MSEVLRRRTRRSWARVHKLAQLGHR